MAIQNLLASLSSVPSAAVIFFFVLGAILIAELWYLRPKRKLPPIPPSPAPVVPPLPGVPTAPFPSTRPSPAGDKPLSQKQLYLVGFLIFLLVVIPLAVFLFKRTQDVQKEVVLAPSPTTMVRELAPPTRTPFAVPAPTLIPLPGAATPSATPRELAGGKLTIPTATPTSKPTVTPTATPDRRSKGGTVFPTASATPLPKTKKPEELPDASFSDQFFFFILAGLPALLMGANQIKRKLG